jgi:hypothetical protein
MCVYENRKVLNDTITPKYLCTLIVQNNGAHLNWATYALVVHEKKVSLQLTRENQIILQLHLPQGPPLHVVTNLLNF